MSTAVSTKNVRESPTITTSLVPTSLSTEQPTEQPIEPLTIEPLTIGQLTDRIDVHVHTYLSPSFLQTLKPSDSALLLHPTADFAAHLSQIAEAYSCVCIGIWKLSLTSDTATVQRLTPPLSTDATSLMPENQQLVASVKLLCDRWATGKHAYPQNVFFQNVTTLSTLREKWSNPQIQVSLQQATQHLYRSTPTNIWLQTYPTCWAYAIGRTMHQLLQWNHRLTPSALREFLSITE